MNQNLYFEDIKIGMEIPTIKKNPTTQQLVKYAGASGDFYQIHYDMDYAKKYCSIVTPYYIKWVI